MPKTKLGTETKNYGYKKTKTIPVCRINDLLKNDELEAYAQKCISDKSCENSTKEILTIIKNPFPCCVISNIIKNDEFMIGLVKELNQLDFIPKNNDLYKFRQSAALSSSSGPHIAQVKSVLLGEIKPWISRMMGVNLEESVDLFCAQYSHTDTLLCHDDELEGRRIAFILYLTEDWTDGDGGLLELFDTDVDGNPKDVVTRLTPNYNSMAFFEVSPVSFHQVSEVLTLSKTRLSLSGWFHGKSIPRPERVIPQQLPCVGYSEVDEELFFSWINPLFLDPQNQSEIQSNFEESSEISLPGFFQSDKYDIVCEALRNHSKWELEGPPDRRSCQIISNEKSGPLENLIQLLTSDAFFLLLSNLTGLKLHELAPEDSDDEGKEDNPKEYNPRCRGRFCCWSSGCYTLIRDDDTELAEYALDLRMFFNVSGWREDMGGQTIYIARDEDEELVTVAPEENTLNLVYRDKDSLKFVKYVNTTVGEIGKFHDVAYTYYE